MVNEEIAERIAALVEQIKKHQENDEAILTQIADLRAMIESEEAKKKNHD